MLDRLLRVLYVVSLNPSQKYGSLEEQIFLTSIAVSQQKGLLLPVFSGEMLNKQKKQYQDAGLISESLNLSQFNLSTLRRLLRLIDHHRIDVVHWNLYHPLNGYVSSLRLLRPRLRHYLTDHNSRPQSFTNSQSWLMGLYKKVMLGGFSKVLGVSDYILSELKKQATWNNPGRYYHFVNTERFKPDERVRLATRTSQGFHGSFVILVVAHLIPEKGVDVAIRALKELPDRVVLWVIGDGPERLALQRAAESLGVHKRTLLCPSLWEEAAGLVILEAMACGLPVIGSSVGGIPEFITPDHTGFLFPAGNHMALANHITRLCSSTPLWDNMRAQARAQAIAQFSHSSRISDAVAIYKTPDP